MLLQLCTWSEVEAYLKRSVGIIVPIGSTEQHGPNGLIGTDAICAESVAKGLGEAAEALVAPTIAVGMAQHHMAFPGTMTLRPSTFIQVVRDCVVSLAAHGFRRFYFVNGHGGNIAPVTSAFGEIYAETSMAPRDGRASSDARSPRDAGDHRGGVVCTLRNWWLRPPVVALAKELYGEHEGLHATPSEVSLTQYVYPQAIKTAKMDPAPPATLDFADAFDFRRRFPDGRMGSHPALSTPEHGRRFYDTVVADLAKDYRTFVTA
ncbi:MAG: creatininase family protein [Alphaproteobacteria bacterium]|nr:creatininase family protein [Alphaproteobacteria bacterium]